MDTTINQRIKSIADELFNGNISALSRAISAPQSTIRDIVGERQTEPSYETIRKIVAESTMNINAEWLLIGTGNMLHDKQKNEVESILLAPLMDRIQNLSVQLYVAQEEISKLRKEKKYSEPTNFDVAAEPELKLEKKS